jgi:3',5'-cyclic-AMP phosphodiesterase
MAAEPFLLAQLSDSHVSDDDDGRALALAAAVRWVLALDPAPGAVLVSGDLTEHGSASEYERVRELLSALTMPVHVLAGNHDDPAVMRKSFPLPLAAAGTPSEDYRYATRCGPLRLVACDTTQPGRDDGAFGDERLAWLEAQLTEDRDTPTIVAMHHLPLPTGIPAMDALGLPRGDRVAIDELVAAFPHVGAIVTGHVHRAVVGTLGGCAVFACPSAWMQLALDLQEPTRVKMVREPPAFGLHVAVAGELVSHVQPIGEW